MKQKKEISLLDIFLLILVFLLFDLVLIFYPAFPNKIFVTWLSTSGKELVLKKEIGIFILPATIIINFIALSMLPLLVKKELRKKQLYSLKLISTLFLIIFYVLIILKNTSILNFSLTQTLSLIFFLLSFSAGSLLVMKGFKDKPISIFQQNNLEHLSSSFIASLIEGIVIIIIGISVLNAFVFQDWLRTIGFISFSCSISYIFFFIYLFIVKKMQHKQKVESLVLEVTKKNEPVQEKIIPNPVLTTAIVPQNLPKQKTMDSVNIAPIAVEKNEKENNIKKVKAQKTKKLKIKKEN